jgi:hypothetical protein
LRMACSISGAVTECIGSIFVSGCSREMEPGND